MIGSFMERYSAKVCYGGGGGGGGGGGWSTAKAVSCVAVGVGTAGAAYVAAIAPPTPVKGVAAITALAGNYALASFCRP